MGLDNGVLLYTKEKIKDPPKELGYRLSDYYIDENTHEYVYDICYWRKCWNIRRGVAFALDLSLTYVYDELDIDGVKTIWQVIYDLNSRKVWDGDYSDSIWTYDEIHDQLDYDLLALEWLIHYMRTHDEARAEFYDSY